MIFLFGKNILDRCGSFHHFSYMLGSCSAAASENHSAPAGKLCHILRKFVRSYAECSLSVHNLRYSRIRFYYDGYRSILSELSYYVQHLIRSEGAVHSQSIHSQTLKHGCHCCGSRPCHKSSPFVICICNENRKIAVLLRRNNSSLCFIRIVHGFDYDKIRSAVGRRPDIIRKY